MESYFTRIMRPVKRQGAERYVRLTLIAFAISVALTRLFLSMTGYPSVGGGTYHIAHLLWGGTLLFVASLLPLVLSNRWVYSAGGVLSGVGVGLFIDEVGKFITRNNDYFYPAAAPIIYAFFLLTVLFYLRIRRPPPMDPRAELYRIFDDMSEVLDHDLDPRERADLEARLKVVATQTDQPDYARLARLLLEFLNSATSILVNPQPGPLSRFWARVRAFETRVLTRSRYRAMLASALIVLGLLSIGQLVALSASVSEPAAVPPEVQKAAGLPAATPAVGGNIAPEANPDAISPAAPGQSTDTVELPNRPVRPEVSSLRARIAFWLRVGLESLVGALLLSAAYYFMTRRDRPAVAVGTFALLIALTMLNLLVFYFDQFAAVAGAVVQFGVYQSLVHYRKRYLRGAE